MTPEVDGPQQGALVAEQHRLTRRIEMLERLAEIRSNGLLSEEAVESLKQRVLDDEFNAGVS
ncbi:uncharacterized protein METZ01_LOCUS292883, partial [marine metagenome]